MGEATPRLRGRAGKAQRARRMQRTNWMCEECLKVGLYREAKVVNHKIPLIHGGPDTDDNTENLCIDHDRKATAKQFGHRIKQAIGLDGWPT